jgi:phosphoribosylaminoimidazolecarboxamide formyltransferase / IMP cyclohydrolase
MAKIRRALLSVTDKAGLVEFARQLESFGVQLISTGGTAQLLRTNGLAVQEVAEVTGFPEMLDGRVKTIHPRIAGGVLARRGVPAHLQSLADHDIPLIDMVVVNLYDFARYANKPGVAQEELIENIDIGGPTLIRAAAKNFQDVAVLVSPSQYEQVATEISQTGELSRETHWRLAQQAFANTASYDSAIAERLGRMSFDGGEQPEADFPGTLRFSAERTATLRYGENPHQKAALYGYRHGGVADGTQLHGKELSFNNLVDLDAAWQLVHEFDRPAVAIIKHTNPCGCAEQETLQEAYLKALEADRVSAFGGVVAANREVDAATARELASIFLEAIAAPSFSEEALAILTAKKNLRLLSVGKRNAPELVLKSISGGLLVQTEDALDLDPDHLVVKTKRAPTDAETRALRFAWKVCKHVKSNAIVYALDGQTVSVGAGQMSRVDSVKVGAQKAVLPLTGTVLASDAFFPFADGVEEAAQHGITAIIQPGGSVRDSEVIEAADRLGLAMLFTGVRHFRH